MADLWAEIELMADDSLRLVQGERVREMMREIGEVFTPTPLVIEMLREMPSDALAPGKSVLDPACGDGQFLAVAKAVKIILHGMSEDKALGDIFGVDIFRDNVDLCRRRLGGGTIIMGDTLNPERALEGQTEEERILMCQFFAEKGVQQQLAV